MVFYLILIYFCKIRNLRPLDFFLSFSQVNILLELDLIHLSQNPFLLSCFFFLLLYCITLSASVVICFPRTMDAQWSPFFRNPKLLGLDRQFGQINIGAFGVFLAHLSAPILVLWVPFPCFSLINYYFYKYRISLINVLPWIMSPLE